MGDLVYLKVQPYKQTSLAIRSSLKLASKFYGPYEVLERIGLVAYKLHLPPDSQIHPIFHISIITPLARQLLHQIIQDYVKNLTLQYHPGAAFI